MQSDLQLHQFHSPRIVSVDWPGLAPASGFQTVGVNSVFPDQVVNHRPGAIVGQFGIVRLGTVAVGVTFNRQSQLRFVLKQASDFLEGLERFALNNILVRIKQNAMGDDPPGLRRTGSS